MALASQNNNNNNGWMDGLKKTKLLSKELDAAHFSGCLTTLTESPCN